MVYPVETLSAEIVETYYRNDLSLFWEYMADDIVWIGPVTSQYMMGKEKLMETWAKEDHSLTFSTSNFNSMLMPGTGISTCEVVVKFDVYTHFKDNYVSVHHQRITFFWKKVKIDKERVWRYAVMHISNGHDGDERDTIYPVHYDEFTKNRYKSTTPLTIVESSIANSLILRAEDYSTYYIDPNSVVYIKALNKLCEVHTRTGILRVRMLMNNVETQLPAYFYRSHRSYIINLHELYHLTNTTLTLRDGTVLPIPYKKHSQIQADLAERIRQQK